MCPVRILAQNTDICLYSIKWVYNREGVCLLRGTIWVLNETEFSFSLKITPATGHQGP
jgi:hypothetical protein